ncbi:MAG TPA: ATP-binding protein [Candidatus Acidoferrum sp.]
MLPDSLSTAPRTKSVSTSELARRSGQKAWLLVFLLLLFVLPLVAGPYWMYLQSKEEITREELQSDLLHARSLSALAEKDFVSAESILSSVADRASLQEQWARHDTPSMEAHLRETQKLEPAFLFVGIFDLAGTARVFVPPANIIGHNFAYRDWFRGVRAHDQPYVSEVYRTAVPPYPLVVAVAVPVRDAHGDAVAILMGTYSLTQLTQKFSRIERGAASEYFIVDQHGVIAASLDERTHNEVIQLPVPEATNAALAGHEGDARLKLNGRDSFVGFAPVRSLNWAVVYARPESVALAPAFHLEAKYRSVSLYLLLVYLATAALAALLMRRQTAMLAANQALNIELEERVAQSKAARDELDRYFTLSIDMLCILGSNGYFKRVNPAWEKVLGYSTEELLSKPRMEFIHPEDWAASVQEIEKLSKGVPTVEFENRYLCKDGTYKWLSWHATPLPEQQLIYAVARDVTELKLAQAELLRAKEQAENSNKFKDQFLSTMSHELRTPLNAVVGFSDLLTEEQYGPLNDRQRRYVKHISAGGHHLLRLINDILDLSKIEAGRLQLSIESVALEGTFTDVVDALRALADKKNLTLVQHPAPDLSVRADSTRLKQILMNLLGNAIKFTPEGGTIEVAAHQTGDFVRVEVRDSGPGIPEEEQRHIFEAFYRLGQTEKSVEGTGLGLAITCRLVELQNGSLGIESKPGSGSCFFFTLPMVATVLKHEQPSGAAQFTMGGVPRILVVEDDSTAALLLESQLSSAGYEVILCHEPERAVEMAAEIQPSAITLDIIMKPVGGWDILSTLKSDSRTAHIPTIVVSIVDEQAVGSLLGADEYVLKPVEKSVLLAAIERCLHRLGRRERRGGSIMIVEDDAATREFVSELLCKEGYKIKAAADVAEARAQIRAALPDLVILDLILPDGNGFQLVAEWRANARTSDLPIFVLTSKDLTTAERDYLSSNAGALFRKQDLWQQALIKQLQRAVSPALVGRS